MNIYEYKVIDDRKDPVDLERLQTLGREGWEFVVLDFDRDNRTLSDHGRRWYFKRIADDPRTELLRQALKFDNPEHLESYDYSAWRSAAEEIVG